MINKLLFVENKEQFKEYVKIAITRIIGILIPVVILFIYLIASRALQEFINYAVIGITTFSNKISYLGLFKNEKIEIRIFSMLMPISIILMAITLIFTKFLKMENIKIKNLLTILMYSLSIIIVMYPISDEIHFLIGSFISIVGLAYMLSLLCQNIYVQINYSRKYKLYKIVSLIIWILIFTLISVKSINNLYVYIKTEKNIDIQYFKNVEVGDGLKQRINDIDDYILKMEKEGRKVYILDAEAAIYMIPLDKYNKDYDMFLKGNIGKDGEEGQIEKIKQKDESTLYLIRKKNMKSNWQTPMNVVKYIRDNLVRIGEISIYEIYK